jgi:hypothetical protein
MSQVWRGRQRGGVFNSQTPEGEKDGWPASQKLVGLEGFEPLTHGLGILFRMLILK